MAGEVSEIDPFKPGKRVRMRYYDYWAKGEITISTENSCKVMFDGDYDLPYDYYPKKDLELLDDTFLGEE